MKAAEIRSAFLKYFEKNGHTIVESSSLVPQNDPTLLFTNAGMVQFKDAFLGKEKRPYVRATTSQKCVRAGGKHNDLENVGFTARHHTFFEMLGNFSFGDYFKKDAIHFAWEFLTKILKLSKDRLYVSVFETDDEAADIWHKQEGVPKDRIYRFGEKDNFWAMGDTGPCGPCSEIYIDRGEQYACGKSTCGPGCDCDRYVEIWNLVFMQFNRTADGKLNPLPKPSVDTGAGLERIATVLQGVDTNYENDLFLEIIQKTAKLATIPYNQKSERAVSFRVIADHSRSATFLIGDGVLPSNEGRGYVLRRIIRRAIRHGKKLDFKGPFFYKTIGFVIDQMKDAYPDIADKRSFIEKVVLNEEEQFLKTLDRGLSLLAEETQKLGSSKTLPGEVAFKLYDTYGFPLDLTRVICAESGIDIDEAGFEKSMDRQRSESRKHWKGSGEVSLDSTYLQLAQELKEKGTLPKFVGYESQVSQSKCLALLVPQNEGASHQSNSYSTPPAATTADSQEKSPIIEAVFAETPFYAESGGQVGDRGRVVGPGFEAEVIDVQKPAPDLIVAHLVPKKGSIRVGEVYTQETDRELRALTARNHTATHMLQWALREVLGSHVKQAGSLVAPDLLRFDFTHFKPMSEEEILRTEDLLNAKIWNAESVIKQEMKKDEALAAGAIAFFGEKYGERVRVVKVGSFSTELCGGTHVNNSSDIHLFKIANESGIAAGVRRIIAYTSKGAFDYLRKRDQDIKQVRDRLRASSTDEIMGKIDKMASAEKEIRKQLEQLQSQLAGGEIDEMISKSYAGAGGGRVIIGLCQPNEQGVKHLREMADRLKQKVADAVIVLGIRDDASGKAFVLATKGPKAPSQFNSNELIQKIAHLIEGKGGGKPDLAQAGGSLSKGLESALEEARKIVAPSK